MARGTTFTETPKSYAPVGSCIYCGSSGGSGASDSNLTDEHIVALALGGPWVLPKSSCLACATIIGRDEVRVLRGGLWAVRELLEFPSRSRSAPSQFPLFCINGDENRRVLIDAVDYPVLLALPRFMGPQLSDLPDKLRLPEAPWHRFLRLDPANIHAKYGIASYAPMSISAQSFARMLAKIAHSFAVAELGTDNFYPFLPDLILGNRPDYLRFIGSSVEVVDPTEHSHSVQIVSVGEPPSRLFVARIGLFSNYGAPGYRVILGRPNEDKDPVFDGQSPRFDEFAYAAELRMQITLADEQPAGFKRINDSGVLEQ